MHIARLERPIEPDGREHDFDLTATRFGVVSTVDDHALLEGAADVPPRIERGSGILVHVLNGAPLASGDGGLNAAHDCAIELDLPSGLALDAKQRAPERGLTAARLTDKAEGFSRPQGQGNARHRLHRQDHWPQPPPLAAQQNRDVSRLERRSNFLPSKFIWPHSLWPHSLWPHSLWHARAHEPSLWRSSASLQLTKRPGASLTSRGVRRLHCAWAKLQRGLKRQPAGGARGEGTRPWMPMSGTERSGWQASSACV